MHRSAVSIRTIREMPRRATRILPVLFLLTSACGKEATGPIPFRIDITADAVGAPELWLAEDGRPVIGCAVHMMAEASGAGRATWDDAVIRFYAGKENIVFDSVTVPAADVQSAWNNVNILTGERWESQWAIAADVPFSFTLTFNLTPEGQTKPLSVAVPFRCGPPISTSSPPPVIEAVSVQPASPFEPGRQVTVQFTARSSVGLWESLIVLSGSCDTVVVVPGGLKAFATYTVPITLPLDCELGQPLNITIRTFDSALEEGSSLAASGAVADRTPPEVRVWTRLPGLSEGLLTSNVEVYAGQSVSLDVYGSDNLGLRMLIWEIPTLGIRDSAALSGKDTYNHITIVLPAGSEGAHQLRVWVRDASGLESVPSATAPGGLRVYPQFSLPQTTMSVTGGIDDIIIDSRRGLLYLRQRGLRQITFVSMATQSVVRTVTFAEPVWDMDISVGGDSLYTLFVGSRTIQVISLKDASAPVTNIPLTLLDAARNEFPEHFRVTAAGKAMVVSANSSRVLEVDLASGAQRFRTDPSLASGIGSGEFHRSPDHSVLLLAWSGVVYRYDAASDQFGPAVSLVPLGNNPSMTTGGDLIAASKRILDGRTLQVLRTLRAPGADDGARSAIDPTGEFVFTGSEYLGFIKSRVSDGTVIGRTQQTPEPGIVLMSDDGSLLVYAAFNQTSTSHLGWLDPR